MTETEKFRTERLAARSWQIEDLPLAMELWGDPAVTALIDSRGKLTKVQVGEKLRAEIERERSGGVQYWALFDHRNGEFVGCGGLRPWLYMPGEANFEVGVQRTMGPCRRQRCDLRNGIYTSFSDDPRILLHARRGAGHGALGNCLS